MGSFDDHGTLFFYGSFDLTDTILTGDSLYFFDTLFFPGSFDLTDTILTGDSLCFCGSFDFNDTISPDGSLLSHDTLLTEMVNILRKSNII